MTALATCLRLARLTKQCRDASPKRFMFYAAERGVLMADFITLSYSFGASCYIGANRRPRVRRSDAELGPAGQQQSRPRLRAAEDALGRRLDADARPARASRLTSADASAVSYEAPLARRRRHQCRSAREREHRRIVQNVFRTRFIAIDRHPTTPICISEKRHCNDPLNRPLWSPSSQTCMYGT